MHLMFYAGADSVDSSGWRRKAARCLVPLFCVRTLTAHTASHPNLNSLSVFNDARQLYMQNVYALTHALSANLGTSQRAG